MSARIVGENGGESVAVHGGCRAIFRFRLEFTLPYREEEEDEEEKKDIKHKEKDEKEETWIIK